MKSSYLRAWQNELQKAGRGSFAAGYARDSAESTDWRESEVSAGLVNTPRWQVTVRILARNRCWWASMVPAPSSSAAAASPVPSVRITISVILSLTAVIR